MVKHIKLSVITMCLAGCASTAQPVHTSERQVTLADVNLQLARAIQVEDFRLMAFASRRLVFVGLEQENTQRLKILCGVKYIDGSSDILKNGTSKQKRYAYYEFAKAYNEVMVKHCLKAEPTLKSMIE